jgi:hypothetical protein
MADRALVSIFFRQIAVGRTSCGFAGTILPRHIGQSGSRAGFHAFRFAVAKEALAGFLFFAVEAHHVPRTGFLAESAADALVFIHIAGAGLGVDADGTLRAGISTRDRVGALTAGVLIDSAVYRSSGCPGPRIQTGGSGRTERRAGSENRTDRCCVR